jgi:uncharacterized caspase-like protein
MPSPISTPLTFAAPELDADADALVWLAVGVSVVLSVIVDALALWLGKPVLAVKVIVMGPALALASETADSVTVEAARSVPDDADMLAVPDDADAIAVPLSGLRTVCASAVERRAAAIVVEENFIVVVWVLVDVL